MMRFTETEEHRILERARFAGSHAIISDDVLIDLKRRYSEPHRFYHNWDHALSVLSWVNHVCDAIPASMLAPFRNADLREAALYHDAVYDSAGTPSNEQRSADLMRRDYDMEHREGEALILATAKHGQIGSSDCHPAAALFLDCDMASFGEPRWELVIENDENIERELRQQYTQEQINAGCKAFLAKLLAKRNVFLSDYFRQRFELQARENIRRLIERYEAR